MRCRRALMMLLWCVLSATAVLCALAGMKDTALLCFMVLIGTLIARAYDIGKVPA